MNSNLDGQLCCITVNSVFDRTEGSSCLLTGHSVTAHKHCTPLENTTAMVEIEWNASNVYLFTRDV